MEGCRRRVRPPEMMKQLSASGVEMVHGPVGGEMIFVVSKMMCGMRGT